MASNVRVKINSKLKFLYRESIYLTAAYRRLLCNALIQWHLDCGCSSWFPFLEKNLKIKLKKAQNKYIRFCLNLPPISHVDPSHSRKIKLRPARDRLEHLLWKPFLSTRMELYRDVHEMFKPSFLKLYFKMLIDTPLCKTNRSFFFWPKISSKINPRGCKRIPTHSHLVHKRTLK